MRKKVIAALLVIALLACCVAALAACNKKEGERKTEIVYLGDSIAEDILGASPLGLRHEYAYANVIGRRNDLTYYNHSVSGHLTKDLRAILENEDLDYDRARGLLLHVSEADIIHISILGNDVLQDRMDGAFETEPVTMHNIILEAAENEYTSIDRVLNGDTVGGVTTAGSVENIKAIVDALRRLNPDALIIFQSVYNPIMDVDTPLIKQETRDALEAAGFEITLDSLHRLGDLLIERLNSALDAVLAMDGYADAFVIADGHAAFNAVYAADPSRAKDLIYPDGIHPSNEGHAVLADLTQGILEERGLADKDSALQAYKTMRKDLLTDYFAGTSVDTAAASAAIDGAADCAAVTEAFFDATRGVTPDYSEINGDFASRDTRAVDSAISFKIDWANTSIGVLPEGIDSLLPMAISSTTSGVTLRANGTISVELKLGSMVSGFLSNYGGLAGLIGGLDLTFLDTYLTPIMPGFDFDDILASLELAEAALGVKFVADVPEAELNTFLEGLAALLKSAALSPDPVLFIEHKGLYGEEGDIGDADDRLPLGKAIVHGSGKKLLVISYSHAASLSRKALKPYDEDITFIDLATIYPLDRETLVKEYRRVPHALIVQDTPEEGSVGESVLRILAEFSSSLSFRMVSALDAPIPVSRQLEERVLISEERIEEAALSFGL